MGKNRYRDLPCAYCGKVTNLNDGEHVVPACLYAKVVDGRIQRAKVSGCRTCNQKFSKYEARFRNLLVGAGLTVTPERQELWETALRSFRNPVSGRGDFLDLYQQMVPVMHEGERYFKVFPGQNENVLFLVRKVIRGMCVHQHMLPFVPDEHVMADVLKEPVPRAFEPMLTTVYHVPNTADLRVYVDESELPLFHSFWVVKLMEVVFVGMVGMDENKGVGPAGKHFTAARL